VLAAADHDQKTGVAQLNDKVASELSASNSIRYGRMEWWLLLEPVSE